MLIYFGMFSAELSALDSKRVISLKGAGEHQLYLDIFLKYILVFLIQFHSSLLFKLLLHIPPPYFVVNIDLVQLYITSSFELHF